MKSFVSALAVFVLLGISGCSTDSGDDSGGSGADFDSTLYYTRTQVDDLFKGAVQFSYANATAMTISQEGFANGGSVIYPSSSVNGVFFEVFLKNGSAATKTIGLALTSIDSAGSGGAYIKTLPAGAYSQEFVYYPVFGGTAGGTAVVWQDRAQADNTAATDLTGVEIKVTLIQWIRSVK